MIRRPWLAVLVTAICAGGCAQRHPLCMGHRPTADTSQRIAEMSEHERTREMARLSGILCTGEGYERLVAAKVLMAWVRPLADPPILTQPQIAGLADAVVRVSEGDSRYVDVTTLRTARGLWYDRPIDWRLAMEVDGMWIDLPHSMLSEWRIGDSARAWLDGTEVRFDAVTPFTREVNLSRLLGRDPVGAHKWDVELKMIAPGGTAVTVRRQWIFYVDEAK